MTLFARPEALNVDNGKHKELLLDLTSWNIDASVEIMNEYEKEKMKNWEVVGIFDGAFSIRNQGKELGTLFIGRHTAVKLEKFLNENCEAKENPQVLYG